MGYSIRETLKMPEILNHYNNWDIWTFNEFTQLVTKQFKISLCSTCMDRLYTLKECLPKNIEDNLDYPFTEHVILDYNGKDNLDKWIKDNLQEHLNTGRVVYYRTTEPKYYSMSHSRNVAFKLATGDIVNNVDADNYTNKGFCTFLNRLANERPYKAAFSKGKRMMHGRLGFYRNEFIDVLGGYDEDLKGYGADDANLLYRAMLQGFKLMWYGGQFVDRIKTSNNEKGKNFEEKNWRKTEDINKAISEEKLQKKEYKANLNRHWGQCTVIKNFTEELHI